MHVSTTISNQLTGNAQVKVWEIGRCRILEEYQYIYLAV